MFHPLSSEFANVTVSTEAGRFAGMNRQEHFIKLKNKLLSIYDAGEAAAISKIVTAHFDNSGKTLTEEHIQELQQITQQLLSRRPIQYVLNEAWFYGLKLKVNESVLIPRPETEELADWLIKEVKSEKWNLERKKQAADYAQLSIINYPLSILDIGTGSGCIPISIKKNIPEAEVTAVDVCSEALQVAIGNAVTHETEIDFKLLDFLDESRWNELGMFDYIISNPPYIKSSERKTMSEHVLQYEPHKALFVPDEDALIFYKKINEFALQHLKTGGSVYFEINQQLGKETAEVFKKCGFANVDLKKDMSGNERFVKADL